MMLRRHVLIAVTFGLLPFGHVLFGSGPAFTMYARLVEFRLELRGREAGGGEKRLYPSMLASALTPSARPFLTGAEEFRRVGDVAVLRDHLRDIGEIACARESTLADVEVVLIERDGGREATTTRGVRCRR